jgi:hypothetical protein
VHNDTFDLQSELLDPDSFIQLVRILSLLALSGMNIEILENPLAGAVADMLGMKFFPSPRPLARPGRLVVLADGNITLAHSMRTSLGEYAPGVLRTILSSAMYQNEITGNNALCDSCRHTSVCRKNKMLRPSEAVRDMITETPFCKRTLDIAAESAVHTASNN